MTREEAIEILCAYGVPQDEKGFREALDMAIEALTQDSRKVTQDSTQDLIIRQDAIEAIAKRIYHIEDGNENDALRKAICDIDTLPSVNAIPYDSTVTLNSPTIIKATSTDLISRQDALKPFCIAPDGTRIPEVDCDNFPVEFSVEFIKKHLLSLPSAEPKTGHWVEIEDYNGDIHYQCDQCGEEFILIDGTPEDNNYWYCPNCGSYNREVRKNED